VGVRGGEAALGGTVLLDALITSFEGGEGFSTTVGNWDNGLDDGLDDDLGDDLDSMASQLESMIRERAWLENPKGEWMRAMMSLLLRAEILESKSLDPLISVTKAM